MLYSGGPLTRLPAAVPADANCLFHAWSTAIVAWGYINVHRAKGSDLHRDGDQRYTDTIFVRSTDAAASIVHADENS